MYLASHISRIRKGLPINFNNLEVGDIVYIKYQSTLVKEDRDYSMYFILDKNYKKYGHFYALSLDFMRYPIFERFLETYCKLTYSFRRNVNYEVTTFPYKSGSSPKSVYEKGVKILRLTKAYRLLKPEGIEVCKLIDYKLRTKPLIDEYEKQRNIFRGYSKERIQGDTNSTNPAKDPKES